MNTSKEHILNRRGVALITVIWVLLALSVITVHMCRSARMDMGSLAWYEDEIKAGSLARSALLEATAMLAHMKTETAAGGDIIKDKEGNEIGSYSFFIVDESGRLYLNNASAEEIRTLLNLTGAPGAETTASRLLDMLSKHPGGGPAFAGELLDVDGIDKIVFWGEDADDDLTLDAGENDGDESAPDDNRDGELDFGLRRHIQVSCGGKVNLNRATREVLMAVFATTGEVADRIIGEVEKSGGEATLASMKKNSSLSEVIKEDINIKVMDRSECFRIRAEGVSGSAVREISAYYRVNPDGGARLLHWWEP